MSLIYSTLTVIVDEDLTLADLEARGATVTIQINLTQV